jgi:N6-L-threonylcarbamoyladenine synthase
MNILGIETSCDETAAAVVKDGVFVLSNVIASQVEIHKETGGVVPEVAAREHALRIIPVVDEALKSAGCTKKEIDAIAVTKGPGLNTSLLIGANAAHTLALALDKSLIPVHHIEGHMYANLLTTGHVAPTSLKFPALVLTASGGHNELILWEDHGHYTFLGSTMDDAAGEAFDKVARLIGLPYPGGPEIEKLAQKGNKDLVELPLPYPKTFDFSFSGLKTAVLYLIKKLTDDGAKELSEELRAAIAARFQYNVCTVMANKLYKAAEEYNLREIHLAGGVSANGYLREKVEKRFESYGSGLTFRFPERQLCTDNAAMIAAVGFYRYKASPENYKNWEAISTNPNLQIENW